MRPRTQAPTGQREKALRAMAYYMTIPGLLGVMTGLYLIVLFDDVLDVRAMHDNGDDLPLVAFLFIFMVVMYVFMAAVPRLMFFLFRTEPGMKDAVKAIWTDDNGEDIPSVERIPEYKRTYPKGINPIAVIHVLMCFTPMMVSWVVIMEISKALASFAEDVQDDTLVSTAFGLLAFLTAFLLLGFSAYISAWVMRNAFPDEFRAMLSYEDNRKEIEQATQRNNDQTSEGPDKEE